MLKNIQIQSSPELGTSQPYRPTNMIQAEDYAKAIEEIFDKFKTEIKDDKSNALAHTIDALKDHTTRMFPMMKEADTDTVL